jgi:hypothetical protein
MPENSEQLKQFWTWLVIYPKNLGKIRPRTRLRVTKRVIASTISTKSEATDFSIVFFELQLIFNKIWTNYFPVVWINIFFFQFFSWLNRKFDLKLWNVQKTKGKQTNVLWKKATLFIKKLFVYILFLEIFENFKTNHFQIQYKNNPKFHLVSHNL